MGAATSDVVQPPAAPPGDGGYGGGGGPNDWGSARRASYLGLAILLAMIGMIFLALSGLYAARRGMEEGWHKAPLPALLWINSCVILASSGVLEVGRQSLRHGHRRAFNAWWTAGTLLGVAFFGGQVVAWRQLQASGGYLDGNPAASFFFLLTAAHAAHLLGGIGALAYVDVRALRFELGPARRTGADIAAIFWHFLTALWMYLLALFSFWG